MSMNNGPQNLKDIIAKKNAVKPPAYEWQDLALRIVRELGVPPNKKSAVFKACKNNSKMAVERALNETKELAKKERWKYFFKLIDQNKNGSS